MQRRSWKDFLVFEFDNNWSFGKNINERLAFGCENGIMRNEMDQWEERISCVTFDSRNLLRNILFANIASVFVCFCILLATCRVTPVMWNGPTLRNVCVHIMWCVFIYLFVCLFLFYFFDFNFFHWKSMILAVVVVVVVTELLMHCAIQCLNKMQSVRLNLVVVAIIRNRALVTRRINNKEL